MTYDLAIEMVFLDHNNIDALGVLEGKEAETSRTAGSTIAHDGAFDDFAELCEVVLQRLYGKSVRITI